MGSQTQSPGISRPGRILCWKSVCCLDTLLCSFNMVLFSTFQWAVKLFPPFALDVAPFQGDMWFLHEFIAHKWKLQQMARSSPRWCALVGHVAFFLCYYVSNPEQQKDICFFFPTVLWTALRRRRSIRSGAVFTGSRPFGSNISFTSSHTLHFTKSVLFCFTLLSNELFIFSGFDYFYSLTIDTERNTRPV